MSKKKPFAPVVGLGSAFGQSTIPKTNALYEPDTSEADEKIKQNPVPENAPRKIALPATSTVASTAAQNQQVPPVFTFSKHPNIKFTSAPNPDKTENSLGASTNVGNSNVDVKGDVSKKRKIEDVSSPQQGAVIPYVPQNPMVTETAVVPYEAPDPTETDMDSFETEDPTETDMVPLAEQTDRNVNSKSLEDAKRDNQTNQENFNQLLRNLTRGNADQQDIAMSALSAQHRRSNEQMTTMSNGFLAQINSAKVNADRDFQIYKDQRDHELKNAARKAEQELTEAKHAANEALGESKRELAELRRVADNVLTVVKQDNALMVGSLNGQIQKLENELFAVRSALNQKTEGITLKLEEVNKNKSDEIKQLNEKLQASLQENSNAAREHLTAIHAIEKESAKRETEAQLANSSLKNEEKTKLMEISEQSIKTKHQNEELMAQNVSLAAQLAAMNVQMKTETEKNAQSGLEIESRQRALLGDAETSSSTIEKLKAELAVALGNETKQTLLEKSQAETITRLERALEERSVSDNAMKIDYEKDIEIAALKKEVQEAQNLAKEAQVKFGKALEEFHARKSQEEKEKAFAQLEDDYQEMQRNVSELIRQKEQYETNIKIQRESSEALKVKELEDELAKSKIRDARMTEAERLRAEKEQAIREREINELRLLASSRHYEDGHARYDQHGNRVDKYPNLRPRGTMGDISQRFAENTSDVSVRRKLSKREAKEKFINKVTGKKLKKKKKSHVRSREKSAIEKAIFG